MDNNFAHRLSQLRKESGFSQKKVALDLGVSQALLSHYEKGIRECGLSFVLKTANYYGVSCDYLLGRSRSKTGDDFRTNQPASRNQFLGQQRTTISNSISIVFAILEKINSDELNEEMTTYLSLVVYRAYRLLCLEDPKAIFGIGERLYSTETAAEMFRSETSSKRILANEFGSVASKKRKINISVESLEKDYPELTQSLKELIEKLETNMFK